MSLATFTFVFVVGSGYNFGMALSVPNFESLEACQAYGKTVYNRVVISYTRSADVNVYECVSSKGAATWKK